MLIGIDGNEANIRNRVGSNVYAFELLKAIEKIDLTNEYQIYLRETRLPDLPPERTNFVYRVIPPKYFWTQWRLPLDLYCHHPRPKTFFTPGHYAPRFCPMPLVISILDVSFLKFPDSFKPLVTKQLTNWTNYSIHKAVHILTISHATKQDIIDNYNVDEAKITVTYPGVNDRFKAKITPQAIDQVKKKYHLEGKYLFTLGTKQPKKNLPRLIEAFSSLPPHHPTTLVIAGKTWHQFQSTPVSPTGNLAAKIIELDFVTDEDVPALMKGATAFVFPSLHEGFGIPVAEAMTVGVPVIVSRTSSLPEIVADAGILVDPKSCHSISQGIKLALSLSEEKRLQLINRGRIQAQKFNWEKCARQTLEIIYDLATDR